MSDTHLSHAEQPEQPQFDLSAVAEGLRFSTASDVLGWLKSERKQWEWTEGRGEPFQELRNATDRVLGEAVTQVAQAASNGESAAVICQIAAVPFIEGQIPVSSSKEGEFLLAWGRNKPDEALDAFRCWFGWNPVIRVGGDRDYRFPMNRFRTWVQAAIAADGLPDLRVPADCTIADVRRKFEKTCAEQSVLLAGNLDQSSKSREMIDSDHNAFARFVNECKEAFSKLEVEFHGTMARQEKFYKDKLAVHSAVEYWSNRSLKHEKLSRNWGIASVVLLLAAAGVLLYSFPALSAPAGPPGAATDEQTVKSTVAGVREWLGSATRIGLVVACFAWPLRIFVRNYLSNAHLATDAGERAVIVQTFLALLNDEQLQEESELKKLMLGPVIESMFRHASDGIVKDDGMPWQPTMFAEMMKTATSQK